MGAAQLMKKNPFGNMPVVSEEKGVDPHEEEITDEGGAPSIKSIPADHLSTHNLASSMIRFEEGDSLGRLCFIGISDKAGARYETPIPKP